MRAVSAGPEVAGISEGETVAIPDFQSVMRPVLLKAQSGSSLPLIELRERVASPSGELMQARWLKMLQHCLVKS